MRRKAVGDGRKKEEIIGAALELFFAKGFEGTSVREIMKHAGGEVGLFYYYFENKDEAFEQVLDRFFAHYEKNFEAIVEHGRRNPCRVMYDFFTYMEQETILFREKYAKKMHRTVRWAIREHTMELIEPYIRRIVDIQSSYYGVAPALAEDVAALYLSYGVGSAILHEDSDFYSSRQSEIRRGTSLIMNMPPKEQELRIPMAAGEEDLPALEAFLEKGNGLLPEDFLEELKGQYSTRISREELWIYRLQDQIVAACLFSREDEVVELLLVKEGFRRQGLAHRLLETAAAQFPVGSTLSANVLPMELLSKQMLAEAGEEFYQRLGFEESSYAQQYGQMWKRLSIQVPERL